MPLHAHQRGGQCLVYIPAFEFAGHEYVGASLVVKERRAGTHRLLRIGDKRQRLIIDANELARVFGVVAALGDDPDDRLTDIAHLAARQRQDWRRVIIRHARGGDDGFDQVRQILGREHRDDARRGTRRRAIERANARMRLIAPAKGDVQCAGSVVVVGIGAASGEEARVLGAFDAGADDFRPGVDFGRVIHRRRRLCARSPIAHRHGRTARWRRALRYAAPQPAIWSALRRSRCCAE